MSEPRRITGKEVSVEIHERTIPACDIGDGIMERSVIATPHRRFDAEEVEFVVAKGWIVYVAQEDRPDREGAYKGFEVALKRRDARP
jgi:hypothetical protein